MKILAGRPFFTLLAKLQCMDADVRLSDAVLLAEDLQQRCIDCRNNSLSMTVVYGFLILVTQQFHQEKTTLRSCFC